jgi:outer membrane lipoprotein SlyB
MKYRNNSECILMESDTRTAVPGPAIGELHEVRGVFSSSEQMQQAIQELTVSGFDRADLSVPEAAPPVARSTPESSALPADTEDDARQARTVHTSTAAAMAALAGAGITVATGGAAAPAVAAALVAGAAAGGATYAVSSAANSQEQTQLDVRAAAGQLILAVRAPTEAKRSEAEAIMRGAGATDIQPL